MTALGVRVRYLVDCRLKMGWLHGRDSGLGGLAKRSHRRALSATASGSNTHDRWGDAVTACVSQDWRSC